MRLLNLFDWFVNPHPFQTDPLPSALRPQVAGKVLCLRGVEIKLDGVQLFLSGAPWRSMVARPNTQQKEMA